MLPSPAVPNAILPANIGVLDACKDGDNDASSGPLPREIFGRRSGASGPPWAAGCTVGERTITTAKCKRHAPEQIVRKLSEADRRLPEGTEVPDVAKTLKVSEPTYHRRRAQLGGMKADDVSVKGARSRATRSRAW
jgi:hypothetical protein